MSIHQITTIVVTALTLLCPYLPCGKCCEGCVDGMVAKAPEEPASIDNACCSTCESVVHEHSPVQSECPNEGKLLTCFCGGAVVTAPIDCPDLTDSEFLPISRILDLHRPQVSAVRLNLVLAPDAGCHFPPLASGRDICNLSSSYLL